jgi:hypothetical protein
MRNLVQRFAHLRQRPEFLLYVMTAGIPLSFAVWQALLNNFAIERAAFTGAEMGILQSLREIPGFLAFTVVFVLLLMREQTLAFVSLLLLGVGTALTGSFPTVLGLYCTTVLMSVGFHYLETVQNSLALHAFGGVWLAFDFAGLEFHYVYLFGGGATALLALVCWLGFPRFAQPVIQNKQLVLRPRYWLYYALTMMSGARRQIFLVFAGFLLVEKFGYTVGQIAALFLVNAAINIWLAPRVGRIIARFGERNALVFEYIGLIIVFAAYAFVDDARVAAGLYLIDHLFYALAIAIKTYFQKIADPADIASTAGVSFTINHIAAVVVPAAFGMVWLVSPPAVFLAGAAMAAASLLLAFNVPRHPQPGHEALVGRLRPAPAAE